MIPQGKYRIMTFKEFVPDKLRFLILLFAALVFQFSNSIYLTNLNEIVGGKSLTTEDIKTLASASFIGMTMIFPILFRIKFRFTSRTILLTSSLVIIVGNLICLYSNNMLILLVTSLVVGMFRMIGTFECLSAIQLVITPKRDFTVFFSVVYLIVLGSIQLSGLLNAEISTLYNWRYMYILIISLQLLVMAVLWFLMKPIRLMKKIPLYQIDWLGMTLWTLLLLTLNFVFEYGKRLDWLDSTYIRVAIVTSCFLLIFAIQRMIGLRRPYILPEIFKYKNLLKSLLLLAILQIFLSTSNTIMSVYTGGILHYDMLHNTSLNWAVFVGVAIGAAFAYYWVSIYRGSYKAIFLVGFLCFVLMHFILFFLFQPSISKEDLYLPYALKGFGYVALYISIALYAAQGIPFPHFFGSLTILGFVRTALGGTMANSLCSSVLQYIQKKKVIVLSQEIDFVNPTSNYIYNNVFNGAKSIGQTVEQAQITATQALYGNVNMQAMLQIFGGITLLGILVLLGILFTYYRKPSFTIFPQLSNIWNNTWEKVYKKS